MLLHVASSVENPLPSGNVGHPRACGLHHIRKPRSERAWERERERNREGARGFSVLCRIGESCSRAWPTFLAFNSSFYYYFFFFFHLLLFFHIFFLKYAQGATKKVTKIVVVRYFSKEEKVHNAGWILKHKFSAQQNHK